MRALEKAKGARILPYPDKQAAKPLTAVVRYRRFLDGGAVGAGMWRSQTVSNSWHIFGHASSSTRFMSPACRPRAAIALRCCSNSLLMCCCAARREADLQVVGDNLGYADIRTTSMYLHLEAMQSP